MKERRHHKRFKVDPAVVAALRLINESKVLIFSVDNISMNGLLLVGETRDYPLTKDMSTEITLHIPKPKETLKITFEAVVIEPREENRFGMHIVKIDPQNLENLKLFTEALEKND